MCMCVSVCGGDILAGGGEREWKEEGHNNYMNVGNVYREKIQTEQQGNFTGFHSSLIIL